MKTYFIGNQLFDYTEFEKGTIEECYNYIKEQKELCIDIETSRKYNKGEYSEEIYRAGLDPYLSRVVMLQIGTLEKRFVIDTRVINITPLLPVLNNPNILFIGHNLRFEAKHLYHNYKVVFHRIYDTMLVEQVITNGLGYSKFKNPNGVRYSLAALAEKYLKIKNIEEVDLFTEYDEEDVFIDKSTRLAFLEIEDAPFTTKQILYGADDITLPLQIKALQEQNPYYPIRAIGLENEFCLVLADVELNGLRFDPKIWLETYNQELPVFQRRLKTLNDFVINNHPSFCSSPDLFASEPRCNILWSSSDQVIQFFRYLGFCPKEKSKQTKKMEWTVGAKSLMKLLSNTYKDYYEKEHETEIKSNEDLILNYLLLKVSEQAITTFGKDWLKYIHPITGRVHTTFRQILNTGRISSTRPKYWALY